MRSLLKKVLPALVLTATLLASSGCMFMNDEDRDFYGKGWVKPSDLDKPLPHHAIPDPSHPEYREPAADSSAQTASAQPDPQWLVPEQAPH